MVGGSNTDRAKLVLFINKSFKGRLFIHKSGGESVGGSTVRNCAVCTEGGMGVVQHHDDVAPLTEGMGSA